MVQSYCANELRSNDYERYLSALFIPNHHREAVFTIYAFNSEVSRTREMVSESILGEIRLQWWREAIQKIYTESDKISIVFYSICFSSAALLFKVGAAPFHN